MQLLKWPRRLVLVCRGEVSPDEDLAPLSPTGAKAAHAAGKLLLAESWRPHCVFVAPDLGCRQTAALVLSAIGLAPDPDLVSPRSIVKPAAGVKVSLLGGPIAVEHDERLRDRELGRPGEADPGSLAFRSPGGESHHDVTLRVRSFLADLGRPHAGETLLVVTHKAVHAAIRRLLDPVPEAEAERDLAALLEEPPIAEGFDSNGPLARQRLLQGFYRMAEVTQKGTSTMVTRLLRRSGVDGDEEADFGRVPEDPPAVPFPAKVLLTYLSAGNGHRIAAQAIEAELKARFPTLDVHPPHDLAELSRPGKWQAALFYKVVDWHLYSNLYSLADRVKAPDKLGPLRQEFMQLASRKFRALLERVNPDVVIHCHPHGTELLASLEGELSRPIASYQVVTDCYGHSFYVLPGVDGTFVPNPDVAAQLVAKGMPPQAVFVTGIPIHPIFSHQPDPATVRDRLGIPRTARVLLVQGNLLDETSDYLALMERLDADFATDTAGRDLEVAVACGKNDILRGELETLARVFKGRVRLRPHDPLSSPEMRDLMRAADLSLTKPGGLTTAESLAMDLPMVLLEVMGGGQERHNADYCNREGAAVVAGDAAEAVRQVASLLARPDRLVEMRANAARLARAGAAAAIADTVVAQLVARALSR